MSFDRHGLQIFGILSPLDVLGPYRAAIDQDGDLADGQVVLRVDFGPDRDRSGGRTRSLDGGEDSDPRRFLAAQVVGVAQVERFGRVRLLGVGQLDRPPDVSRPGGPCR